MRGLLLVMVFVCLAAAAMLWSTASDAAAPAPAAGGESTNTAATPAGSATVPENAPASGPDVAPDNSTVQPRELAPEPTDIAPGNVRVVTFEGDEPVAGASVFYIKPDFDWQSLTATELQELQQLRNKDEKAWFLRIGGEVRTRADGSCDIAVGKNGTQLMARAGERYGSGYVRADSEEQTVLRLRVDVDLHVRVMTADGQPAEGVQAYFTLDEERGNGFRRMGLGASDADGRIVSRHCQMYAGENAECRGNVATLTMGMAGKPVAIDILAPPDEVVLRLPQMGKVRVVVRDSAGQPLDPAYLGRGEQVLLAAHDDESKVDGRGVQLARKGVEVGAGGVAEFDHVPLGKFVVATLGHFGMEARTAGPSVTAPTVEMILQEDPKNVILVGTLLKPTKEPFASGAFRIAYRYTGGSGSLAGSTDNQGRFRCNIGSYVLDEQTTLTFSSVRQLAPEEFSVELSERELQAGKNDLGEVMIVGSRVLLAGRLVRDEGVAAPWVQMEVQRQEEGRWRQDWQLQPKFEDDGTFSIRGGMPANEPLRLVVREGPFLPVPPIDCKVGDTDIEIPLRAAGSVTATFLVDDDEMVGRLSFRCRPVAGGKQSSHARMMERLQSRNMQPAKDGRVSQQWNGLAPGNYLLTVVCAGVERPVVEIPAIVVGVGPCEDPRLVDIDLRGSLRRIEIRATAADGTPIVDREAFVVVRDAAGESVGYNLGKGVVQLFTPTMLSLTVMAPGHEAVDVAAVTASQTVPLRAAPKATLEVQLPKPLPEGVRLELELTAKLDVPRRGRLTLDTGRGMPLRRLFVEKVAVDADGRAVVPVRWPGEYSVTGRISGSRMTLYGFVPSKLTLPGDGVVKLEISAEKLNEVLEFRGR